MNYYPFGLTHQQPLPGQLKNRYLYNGKELTQDFGLGWYDYGFRMYDPAVGRFTGVDPIADEFAHVSTYNYAENEPIANIDLWGLQKVSIHTNSFAPFNTFGGPYRGDGTNRGFQANAGASTRIGAQINIDASSTGVSLVGDPQAIGSESHNTLTGSSTFSEAAFESFSLKDGTLNFHVSGNNDLVPGSSDIDTKGNIGISRTDLGEEGSVINFSGTISGDKFPANETFVTDQAGTGVFLGVSGADGNPFTSLPGDNNRKMSSFNIGVQFNSNGNIQGIQYNGQTYSVTDWKKQFQGLNPQSGNVSTTY